jgi:putative CocE/NonD family hydrolase
MYNTGKKEWQTFDKWPAASATHQKFYLSNDGKLAAAQPAAEAGHKLCERPHKPVPYTEDNTTTMGFTPHNYMSEDQRFAGRRTDVLVFQTDVLTDDITLGGEIMANLKIATTGTDADWIVKLIDVYPPDEKNNDYMPNKNIILSNYQQMVRSQIMPARFRDGFEKAVPMVANQKTDVNFHLNDVLHTFKKGHRIMIQVQSTSLSRCMRATRKNL